MADERTPLERYLSKQKQEKATLAAKAPRAAGSKAPRATESKALPKAKSFFGLGKRTEDVAAAKPADNVRPSLSGIERPPGYEAPQPPSLSRWESVAEERLSDAEERAREAGAPAAPPPRSLQTAPTPAAAPVFSVADDVRPITDRDAQIDMSTNADFGPRLVAAILDGCILGGLSWFAKSIVISCLMVILGSFLEPARDALGWILSLTATYAYYGYFYSVKGASPGKLLLNLEVTDTDGVTKLSPMKAFLRESIGKTISAIPFLMGYIIVLIRADHRALHDLLFDTRVLRKIERPR